MSGDNVIRHAAVVMAHSLRWTLKTRSVDRHALSEEMIAGAVFDIYVVHALYVPQV